MLKTFPIKLIDGKEYALPCVDLRVHTKEYVQKNLPDLPGIYFFVEDNDSIQYIGVSAKVSLRAISPHDGSQFAKRKTWGKRIAFLFFGKNYRYPWYQTKRTSGGWIATKRMTVRQELLALEALCIYKFSPALNTKIPIPTKAQEYIAVVNQIKRHSGFNG